MKTIGLIAVVAIGAGLWFSRSSNDKAGKDGGGAQNKTVDTSPKPYALPIPFKGGADAGAVLVKFTDFQ